MKNLRLTTIVFVAAGVCAALTLRSPPAAGVPVDDVSAEPVGIHAAEATARAAYQARLAANNAAAERWKSAHRDDTPGPSTDEELIATNFGCPEGTQLWQRDILTELCATRCTSDTDCAPEEGRCRVIDVYDEAKVPAAPLVDDTAPEEIDALLTDESRPEPPLLLCDPFWDADGITDLDIFATDAARAP